MSNYRAVDKSYVSIHVWLRKNFGKPKACFNCKIIGEAVKGRWNIHYALRRGQKHEKKRGNYVPLCRGCHSAYDNSPASPKSEKRFRDLTKKVPEKDIKSLLEKKIRDLNKIGYNYREISELLRVSKTTVFYALKGRKLSR